jgi:hypothetical protein
MIIVQIPVDITNDVIKNTLTIGRGIVGEASSNIVLGILVGKRRTTLVIGLIRKVRSQTLSRRATSVSMVLVWRVSWQYALVWCGTES